MKTIYEKSKYDSEIKKYILSGETELSYVARAFYGFEEKPSENEFCFLKKNENVKWFFSKDILIENLERLKAEKISEKIAEIENEFSYDSN